MATRIWNADSYRMVIGLPWRPILHVGREIGRRLAAEGKLDAPDQTMHFAFSDVTCWLRGYWDGDGARELATDRIVRRASWLAEDAPDLITEEPDGRMIAPPPAAFATGSGTWIGLGVSPGRAEGAVRILRNPGESGRLQFGDVLVAPSTDPG